MSYNPCFYKIRSHQTSAFSLYQTCLTAIILTQASSANMLLAPSSRSSSKPFINASKLSASQSTFLDTVPQTSIQKRSVIRGSTPLSPVHETEPAVAH